MRIIESLSQKKKTALAYLLACLFVVGLIGFIMLFSHFRFENSDDILFVKAFMGFEGGIPSNENLYTNPILASILATLSNKWTGIAWFSILLVFSWIISLIIIIKEIIFYGLNNNKIILSILFSGLFTSIFLLFDFARVSYTTTVAVLSTAAVVKCLTINFNSPFSFKKALNFLCVALLIFLAYSLRSVAFIATMPFLITCIAYKLKECKNIKQWLAFLILIVCIPLALYGVTEVVNLTEKKQTFRDFQITRTALFDYTNFESDAMPAITKTDIPESTIKLMQQWYFLDKDINADMFNELLNVYEKEQSISSILNNMVDFFEGSNRYIYAVIVLVFMLGYILLCRKNTLSALFAICIFLGSVLLFIYLCYQGRVLYRGVDCIFIPCASILFYLALTVVPPSKKICLANICILIVICSGAIHFYNTFDLLNNTLDQVSLQRGNEVEKYALNNPNQLIVRTPNLYRDTRLFPDVSGGIPKNIIIWGDFYCRTTTWYNQFNIVGIKGEDFMPKDWLKLTFATTDIPPIELTEHISAALGREVVVKQTGEEGSIKFFNFE